MSYSLNEVESMVRKAARGAGYSWGMAHNAGRAARWMYWHGLDACRPMAALFDLGEQAERAGPQRIAPQLWQSDAGPICPLAVGTGMLDRVDILAEGRATIKDVHLPILIVPFVAATALRLRTTATVEWEGLQAISDGNETALNGDMDALEVSVADEVATWRGGIIQTPLKTVWRARPDPKDWAALSKLAARTYAPATESSRLTGAGAGLIDRD